MEIPDILNKLISPKSQIYCNFLHIKNCYSRSDGEKTLILHSTTYKNYAAFSVEGRIV
jgi:hypothetical protein